MVTVTRRCRPHRSRRGTGCSRVRAREHDLAVLAREGRLRRRRGRKREHCNTKHFATRPATFSPSAWIKDENTLYGEQRGPGVVVVFNRAVVVDPHLDQGPDRAPLSRRPRPEQGVDRRHELAQRLVEHLGCRHAGTSNSTGSPAWSAGWETPSRSVSRTAPRAQLARDSHRSERASRCEAEAKTHIRSRHRPRVPLMIQAQIPDRARQRRIPVPDVHEHVHEPPTRRAYPKASGGPCSRWAKRRERRTSETRNDDAPASLRTQRWSAASPASRTHSDQDDDRIVTSSKPHSTKVRSSRSMLIVVPREGNTVSDRRPAGSLVRDPVRPVPIAHRHDASSHRRRACSRRKTSST